MKKVVYDFMVYSNNQVDIKLGFHMTFFISEADFACKDVSKRL